MNRIKYVDALKFIAIFSIILLHISYIWGNTMMCGEKFNNIREIVRFGVPLFLMVTGMLTLNREIDLELFFKKKFVRIVYPLVFFFIIAFICHVYSNFLTVYWYCWMVIGVYLAIPILNIFIKHANEKEMKYFILMFLLSSLIYTLAQHFGLKLALDLDFFIGPASYLILGYYLANKEFKISNNKIIMICLIIFIIISLIKVIVLNKLCINDNVVVYSCLNLDLPQIIQTTSVFMIIKNIYSSSKGLFNKIRVFLEYNVVNNFILSISRSSYGIYLFHMIIFKGYLMPYLKNIHMTGISTFISIWIISIILLLISWLVILVLGKIPIINKLSGYY